MGQTEKKRKESQERNVRANVRGAVDKDRARRRGEDGVLEQMKLTQVLLHVLLIHHVQWT